LLHGRPTAQLAESVAVAVAAVPDLDPKTLGDRALSPEIEQRIRATTAEFHAFRATQRPTFLLENQIGDRVLFSGIARPEPIIAAIEAMLTDAKAQQAYDATHEPMPG
jgi:predicted DsbA family dithiol-disulfide isomerase